MQQNKLARIFYFQFQVNAKKLLNADKTDTLPKNDGFKRNNLCLMQITMNESKSVSKMVCNHDECNILFASTRIDRCSQVNQ